MNRLTARDERTGNAYFPNCFEGCDGVCGECDHDTDFCERLAAYEDTGLTPDQIIQMDKLYQEKCEELAKLQTEVYGYTE